MGRFPFFKEISGERVLVVGGGKVALRRACVLSELGADVRIVSPRFAEGFDKINAACIQRPFMMEDLDGASIVVAATDDGVLNAEIGRVCAERGIEVNVADNPAACTFQFPAMVRRGKLTIGISAEGISPVAVKNVRERIESVLPDRFEEVLDCMEIARKLSREGIPEQNIRAKVLKEIFDHCLNAAELPDEQMIRDMIRRHPSTEID